VKSFAREGGASAYSIAASHSLPGMPFGRKVQENAAPKLCFIEKFGQDLYQRCKVETETSDLFCHLVIEGNSGLHRAAGAAYIEKLVRDAAPGSLQAVIAKYSAFNCFGGTDKDTRHAYGPLYEKLFAPYKSSAKNVLEIGVYSGASIVVWAEYFAKATVDGIDITNENFRPDLFPLEGNPRLRLYEIDGTLLSAPQDLVKAGGAAVFDVIVEDGSHLPEHQLLHLEVFATSLAPGGIYVIEDIHQQWVHHPDVKESDSLKTKLAEIAQRKGLRMEWYDLRDQKHRFDDLVAVFYSSRSAGLDAPHTATVV